MSSGMYTTAKISLGSSVESESDSNSRHSQRYHYNRTWKCFSLMFESTSPDIDQLTNWTNREFDFQTQYKSDLKF